MLASHKRARSASAELDGCMLGSDFAASPSRPLPGEQMCQYLQRLRTALDCSTFQAKQAIDDPGVYIAKRRIRTAAGSQAELLALAGTVFYHVVVYVKEGDKLVALDFGPEGADITTNLAIAVPAGALLQDPAEPPSSGAGELPLLRVCAPVLPLSHPHMQQALEFAQSRPYHALANNCISTCDFLVRVLTNGAVRGAPLAFDALCGHAAPQDPPLLLMFMLMTGLSWFDVCDGSRLAAAFLQHSGARASTADERRPAKHAESTAAAAISLQAAAPVADALASSHAADTAARGHAAADKGNAVVRSGAAAAVPGHAGDAQEQACTGKPAQRGAGEGMGASAAAGSASSDSVDTLAGVPDSARV